jgi:ceramide glucosyltransferase
VSVLKPLYGAEPTLYECLRSFCLEAGPQVEILCGVRDERDPAVAVVRRLQQQFGAVALELVIDAREHGESGKVSNLINLLARARHELLVLSDADVVVPAGYLREVTARLADPRVGLVTCAYRGRPGPGPWSALLAAFINDWFIPSVHVAALLGSQVFVSGVTIALRRGTLEAIGGFEAIVDQLADDYRLGQLTRKRGLTTVLAPVVVDSCVEEASLTDLIRHELRWLRTIRAVQPIAYASLFLTFSFPVAAIGCALARGSVVAFGLLALTCLARVLLHCRDRGGAVPPPPLWVLLFNDLLAFGLWIGGFLSRRVYWRSHRYRVSRDGSVQQIV